MKEERRKKITNGALYLFATQGFFNTTIDDIARYTGMSKGLLYSYYRGKEDLLRSLISSIVNSMLDHLDLNHDGNISADELAGYIGFVLHSVKENPFYWKLFISVMAQEKVAAFVIADIMPVLKKTQQMLMDYFSQAGYDDPETEIALLSSMLAGVVIKYVGTSGDFPIDKLKQRILTMYKKHSV